MLRYAVSLMPHMASRYHFRHLQYYHSTFSSVRVFDRSLLCLSCT